MPGHYCVVPNCKNSYGNAPELHYYVFPKDTKRASAWALKINRPDLISKNVPSYKRICGIHFEDQMFTSDLKLKLLPSAVPTLVLQTESLVEEITGTTEEIHKSCIETMPGCSAVNCRNRSETKGVRMFAFPSSARQNERREKWIQNIQRANWMPTTGSRVCEIHFEESQFELNRADGWKKLKQDAVPTLFDIPNSPPSKSVYKVHFTSDQFELNRADGKKKLKWNAVPRVFAEKKECTKENTPHDESNRNPLPSDITKNSSSLLQENRCGIFEEVNFVLDSPNLKEEVLITSVEEELENTKCPSQDFKRFHNRIFGTNSEKQCARPFDLTEACRICFGKTQLENIFVATYQDYSLHKLLELCSSIKINKNTKFKQICVRCKSQLIENYSFVRKVITSNNSLQLIELNNKNDSHTTAEDEIEEIFIYIDEPDKPTEIYSEITQQDLSNSLVKFEKNVNNNQEGDTIKTCQNFASESSKIKKINEDVINDSSVNDKNNISKYYLIKADENTLDFTNKGSIFQVPEKEITKILPNLINLTETTNTHLDPERSELEAAATPVQNIDHLQDHSYVNKRKKKLNSSSEDKRSFLCEKCGLSLRSIPNLRTHKRRVHDGIKTLYRCQKCNKFFRSQASYETHRSQHVGKYHCCETCGKMFAGMAHLRQHLRRHSTLRPYVCGVCSKSFRAKYLLKYHVAIHLKEKEYMCPICKGTFLKISELRSHMKKTHPEKIRPKFFTCDKCDYKSLKKRALQIHLKKKHNLVVKDSPKVIVIT